ncbi:hypothetical protein [Pararhodobacter sp.]|nr:hypothetical protein [Pararhodobacter sp.]
MTRKSKPTPSLLLVTSPTKGGSYLRQPDGTLVPVATPEPMPASPTEKEA